MQKLKNFYAGIVAVVGGIGAVCVILAVMLVMMVLSGGLFLIILIGFVSAVIYCEITEDPNKRDDADHRGD